MTQNVRLGAAASVFLFIVWVFIQFIQMEHANTQMQQTLHELTTQAVSFHKLKSQWDAPNRYTQLLALLSAIHAPDKSYVKGKNEHLTFLNLNAQAVDKLVHTIFSSDVTIVSYELSKTSNGVTLELEVAR